MGLKADATPTTEPPPPKDKVDDTYADTGESPLQAVMEVTGNTNVDQVQEVSLCFTLSTVHSVSGWEGNQIGNSELSYCCFIAMRVFIPSYRKEEGDGCGGIIF